VNSLKLIELSIVVQGPNDCEFELDANGFCVWTQDDSDEMNWIRSQGPTLSTSTGPVGDHTSGGGKLSLCTPIQTIYLPSSEFWHLKTEFWHLKTEFWHLKTEFWHLKTEFWHLKTEFWHSKTEFWHLKTEFWHLKTEFWHLKKEFWLLKTEI
jgi:hypothetical protein